MALRFIDGFDHYDTSCVPLKWNYATGYAIASGGGRRPGSSALEVGYQVSKTLDNQGTWIVGFAVTVSNLGGTLVNFIDGSTNTSQATLSLDSVGHLLAKSGSTTLGTVSQPLQANAWVYIEAKVVFSATAGSFAVQINGVPVLDVTGVKTIQNANTYANAITLGIPSGTAYYDDLYICDGTGTRNNDFLDDVIIETIFPDSAGAYSQLTPEGATANWQCVNETPPNNDTTYVVGETAGLRDSYGFQDMPGSGPIAGIQINEWARKDDASVRQIAATIRQGTTDAQGATITLSTNYQDWPTLLETNPANGGAVFTPSDIASDEFGTVIVS